MAIKAVLVGLLAVAFLLLLFGNVIERFRPSAYSYIVSVDPASGGEVTAFITSCQAFSRPAPWLQIPQLRNFTFGNKLFNTNWVTAPASVTSLDGLGPTFNRVSCSGCHFKDGRGRPPHTPEAPMQSMLIRLSLPGTAADSGPLPHPNYGNQLNGKAIQGVLPEGRATIIYDEIPGKYADGTPYTLRKPNYRFEELNFGPIGDQTLFSPRVAPAVFGLGLLEAVEEATVLSLADPDDADNDGLTDLLLHDMGAELAYHHPRLSGKWTRVAHPSPLGYRPSQNRQPTHLLSA